MIGLLPPQRERVPEGRVRALLSDQAIVLANELRLDEASALATRAREEAIVCDDFTALARAADAQGVVARLRGDAPAALDYTTEALAIAESLNDPDLIARAYNDLGRIAADLNHDPDVARDAYQRALAREPGDRTVAARILNNLGNVARDEGDFRQAVAFYSRAGDEASKARDDYGVLTAEHNVGLVFTQQNEPARALTHLRRALALERKLGSNASTARTLLSISEAKRSLGKTGGALADLRDARAAATAVRDTKTVATILLREGDLQLERRNFTAAERAFNRSITLLRNDPALALALTYRARLRLAEHRYTDAAFVAANAVTRATDDETIAQAQTIAGQANHALRNRDAARRAFTAAIEAIERQREHVAGAEESREKQFEAKVLPYLSMVDLASEANDAVTALDYAERAKGRVLIDVMRTRITRPPHFDAAALRDVLAARDDAIIELAVGESALYAFAITRDGVRVFATAIPRTELNAVVNRFAGELAQRNLAFRRTARHLYDLLLAPAAASLRGKRRICIVPDQELWRVPFQALLDAQDRYLADDASIFYAPSIAVLRELMRVPRVVAERPLLAAANPTMAEARSEVQQIAAMYGPAARAVIGARESQIKQEAPHYAVLHFATHGVLDDASPLASHLVFEPGGRDDGRLEAREMMSMHLDAQLVVLSACETAGGRPAPGEGIVGMSWALFVAGCPTMVASEWKVESASTTLMMVAFHRGLGRGLSAAESLRAAQLEVRKRYEHPFYWASFVVLGRGW